MVILDPDTRLEMRLCRRRLFREEVVAKEDIACSASPETVHVLALAEDVGVETEVLVAGCGGAVYAYELRAGGAQGVGPAAAEGAEVVHGAEEGGDGGRGGGGFEEGGEAVGAEGAELGVGDGGGEGGEGEG